MSKIADTRKVFLFKLAAQGLNQFLAQEVNLPTPEVDAVEHGDGNSIAKTAGLVKLGDITINKIKSAGATDTWAWDWLAAAQNISTGTGGVPAQYKRTITITETNAAGVTLNTWLCKGVWCKSISQNNFNRMASDLVIETVTLSVDSYELI